VVPFEILVDNRLMEDGIERRLKCAEHCRLLAAAAWNDRQKAALLSLARLSETEVRLVERSVKLLAASKGLLADVTALLDGRPVGVQGSLPALPFLATDGPSRDT
jgi:hypothetical protein